MKVMEKMRISGIVERRPSASAIPIGIDATMPVTEITSVTKRPPQSRVSTNGNPGDRKVRPHRFARGLHDLTQIRQRPDHERYRLADQNHELSKSPQQRA